MVQGPAEKPGSPEGAVLDTGDGILPWPWGRQPRALGDPATLPAVRLGAKPSGLPASSSFLARPVAALLHQGPCSFHVSWAASFASAMVSGSSCPDLDPSSLTPHPHRTPSSHCRPPVPADSFSPGLESPESSSPAWSQDASHSQAKDKLMIAAPKPGSFQ